ncbi:hypothetical protein MNB_SM-7-689 [hydrothermal vent metagenome]|uniref:DUF3187 domain-containing protein n=1 Tax=hydrothermal vent metagenome TaxID=652676 RepID=A0A1W1C2C8_9ZZZZ
MINYKKIFIIVVGFIATLNLQAYTDSDLDGVDDSVDKCPNTPFMDIVDLNGCTKKSLIKKNSQQSPHHYDIIIGASYSGADYNQASRNDTEATSLQIDYYYKNLSIQTSASYYYSKDSNGYTDKGFYDTFVGASYKIQASQNLKFYIGLGMLLPTYSTSLNNNNTDYKASASVSYSIKNINLFGGYSYTLIGDDDVTITTDNNTSISYKYKNTHSYNGGIGIYATNKLYLSLSYFEGDSIYVGYESIKSASIYGYYTIDNNWFMSLSYARGLSDTATDNYASIRLGYYF